MARRPASGPSQRSGSPSGSTERALELATRAGSDGLLIVRENFIPGWQARIGGLELKPVTVDGWAQGMGGADGAQGTITLTFAPQRPFLVVLVLGGIAGLVLLVMAVRGESRAPARSRPKASRAVQGSS